MTAATARAQGRRPPVPASIVGAPPPVIGSLCTGIAGLDLGLAAALGGAHVAFTADTDPDAARFLAHRFPSTPNLGDVADIEWSRLQPVDIITAGFPCEDVSISGRGAGIAEGTRSGTWAHVMEGVRRLRPRLLIVENVAALRWRWRGAGLDRVLSDLAAAGYDAQWCSLRARDIGAPHNRERLFLAAYPGRPRCRTRPLPSRRAKTPGQADRAARCDPPPRRDQPGGRLLHPELLTDALCTAPAQAPEVADCPLDATGSWGAQETAIRRWEKATSHPAPCPLEPGQRGGRRLNACFTEWLMGFAPGWITDPALRLSRDAHLRLLGRAVIPHQAHAALRLLVTGSDHPEGHPWRSHL
ncbi:DNA cytosine methyltransferase [Streptomonospora sp. S1-112]|uniref:DNA (cytosine-5-)-methyltransferase n=1 Tax=Streptomonospora mangrovi TaxID=2883123 RepID=A0A9X3NK94_9ACTN|nr:DNA cytosine methyltransferase [Streptomonospora mangrovi]MDA0564848.1 DNA cytosine methyltransferase [Streptomonospora mangrovi]